MKTKLSRLAIALAALIALPLLAGETKEKAAEKPAAPAAEAAMKVFVDPATGQIVSPKSDPGAAKAASAAMSAERAQPLRVEKVTTKAGGKKVNLQGRFMMEMTATASPDGKVSQSCNQVATPETAASAEEHHHE